MGGFWGEEIKGNQERLEKRSLIILLVERKVTLKNLGYQVFVGGGFSSRWDLFQKKSPKDDSGWSLK